MDSARRAADEDLARREEQWRPLAREVEAWADRAEAVYAEAEATARLKKVETWMRGAMDDLRAARMSEFEGRAREIWALLRQESNVDLTGITLEGAATRRRADVHVAVDGEEGAALGVMSQGELHALALSLFLPRATSPESPFRFIVIDDPVQAMDPSKVYGLASVLMETARTRQVVVFTHDDRLVDAVRRLSPPPGVNVRILEVSRRERSVVEVRQLHDAVERYLRDARALLKEEHLPLDVARRVVPGLCRYAVEAAAVEAYRKRAYGTGALHEDVDRAVKDATTTLKKLGLALDVDDPGQVCAKLSQRFGGTYVGAVKAANAGAHDGYGDSPADLEDLVRVIDSLCGRVRA